MNKTRKLQKIEENNSDCGKCYDYSSPNNYWQSFYAQQKIR